MQRVPAIYSSIPGSAIRHLRHFIEIRRNTSSTGIDSRPLSGYTSGMKTAISIPDDVFEDAERLASRLRTSRSQLYARALAEFVARHDDDRVTSLMDQAVREAGGEADAFVRAAAQQSLQRVEW